MKKPLMPTVLIVDDIPDELRALRTTLAGKVHVTVLHPQEVEEQHLQKADLVLVDYKLEQWPERDTTQSLALRPQNGLALAAVLRAHAEQLRGKLPTAFAILSAHLLDLSGNLPPQSREHIIARENNLEWAFPKTDAGQPLPLHMQILSLAYAVHRLPTLWPMDNPPQIRRAVNKLLGLSAQEGWAIRAWEDIARCHPPVHELSERSHGLALIRWLLHRILPYPCFLLDTYRLSARLRVTYRSLFDALANDPKFRKTLEGFRYRGILSDSLGRRWWRSGVEAFLWKLTEGNAFDADSLLTALRSRTSTLEASDAKEPVVCVDNQYRPLPEFYEAHSAVRIQPDDWPAYADQAWTTIELAKDHPSLGALVVDQDRGRLK